MAETVAIPNSPGTAKLRSPLAVALLSLVTFGIYAIFWYYYINRELRDLGRSKGTQELGDSPGTSVLAVTLGALVIVPAIVSLYNTCKRIHTAQRLFGPAVTFNGWIALILALLIGPALVAYMQAELNKVWRTVGAPLGAGAQAAIPAQPEAAPAEAPPSPQPAEPPAGPEPGAG
jgi:uncharacterized protein DUF4234